MVSILERSPIDNCSVEIVQRATNASNITRNWVFLGDSLTEGIGSKRISYVTELVEQMRAESKDDSIRPANVHYLRFRTVDHTSFDPFVNFNLAGRMDLDSSIEWPDALCIWNLACEGRTIETDFEWLPVIAAIRPELVVIFRGSLESIIRPAMLQDGAWPFWVPQSWRNYSALDPRCYFSATGWRRFKQIATDRIKQQTRYRLLDLQPGRPLMDLDCFTACYESLLAQLARLTARTLILGLLPVGEHFPQSQHQFEKVNERLRALAINHGAGFCDWAVSLKAHGYETLFCRDTFHPNVEGARRLAHILRSELTQVVNA